MNGEIDVLENVNTLPNSLTTYNQMTLHTSPSCSMSSIVRKQTGSTLTTSCVNTTNSNEGCGVDAGAGTYGKNWNDNKGGILAVELRNEGIRMWQWARGSIPAGIQGTGGATPDPSTWGVATSDFPNTECDIGARFRNQSIVVNISLCGAWAGDAKVYGQNCKSYCFPFQASQSRGQKQSNMKPFVDLMICRSGEMHRSSREQRNRIQRCLLGIWWLLCLQCCLRPVITSAPDTTRRNPQAIKLPSHIRTHQHTNTNTTPRLVILSHCLLAIYFPAWIFRRNHTKLWSFGSGRSPIF